MYLLTSFLSSSFSSSSSSSFPFRRPNDPPPGETIERERERERERDKRDCETKGGRPISRFFVQIFFLASPVFFLWFTSPVAKEPRGAGEDSLLQTGENGREKKEEKLILFFCSGPGSLGQK